MLPPTNIDFERLCKQAGNPMVITKPSFVGENNPEIIYVNDTLCKISGYTFDEIIGNTPKMFQGPNSNKDILSKLKYNLELGKPFEGFTINYRKDGTEYFVEWKISPIFNNNGEIEYYFGIQRDMTDSINHFEYLDNKIKTMEDEKEMQSQLIIEYKKSAAMGDMIDMIAHQWTQPLTIIKGSIELLNNEIDIDEFQEITLKNINHIMETLDEFREFFRPDKKHEKFKVSDVAHSVLILMQDTLKSKKINVELKLDNDIMLDGYPNEFKHIFINFINNSKDAFIINNIENRNIYIGITEDKDKKIIFFCDNAGGISDDIAQNIFNKNFTTKQDNGGTGIGLYMTKEIIEKIGGRIDVKQIENGLCFGIEFNKDKVIDSSTLSYIQELQSHNEIVFYNGSGSPIFYKNNIKHLSYAESLGFCKKIGSLNGFHAFQVEVNYIYVYDQIQHIVQKHTKGTQLKVIPIINLE